VFFEQCFFKSELRYFFLPAIIPSFLLQQEKQDFIPRKQECFAKPKKIFFILKTSYATSSLAFGRPASLS
jgi:hypothetical protein